MKLRSLVAGAQLATRRFLELRSPVLCRSLTLESTPFQAAIFTSEDLLLRLQQKLPYIYIYRVFECFNTCSSSSHKLGGSPH